MRKNNIFMGLILILIAVAMMAGAMGLLPDIPWFKLLCAICIGSWTVKSLFNRDFVSTFLSASLIAWLFERELHIEHLVPFPLCVAAILLGIGLNMIFGKKKKLITINYKDGDTWREANSIDDVRNEEWKDGREVVLENSFNSTSKYVNAAAFSSAHLENNFGSANVYFNNANVYNNEAVIELENNFGEMNIYLPNTWRATISQESAFGHVSVFGEPNRDMDAPHVIIKAESNFGSLRIYFE